MLPPKRWLPGLRPFPIIPHPNTPLPPFNPKRQVIPTDWGHFLYPSDTAPPEHWKVSETVTIRMSTKLSTYTVGLWQNATLIRILTVHSASAGSVTEQTKTTSFDWIVTRSEPNVSAAVVGGLKEPLYRLQATHGSIPENQSRDVRRGLSRRFLVLGRRGVVTRRLRRRSQVRRGLISPLGCRLPRAFSGRRRSHTRRVFPQCRLPFPPPRH